MLGRECGCGWLSRSSTHTRAEWSNLTRRLHPISPNAGPRAGRPGATRRELGGAFSRSTFRRTRWSYTSRDPADKKRIYAGDIAPPVAVPCASLAILAPIFAVHCERSSPPPEPARGLPTALAPPRAPARGPAAAAEPPVPPAPAPPPLPPPPTPLPPLLRAAAAPPPLLQPGPV